MPIPAWANYTKATFSAVACATCAFYDTGVCEMFDDEPVGKDYVCDAWSGMIDKQELDPAYAPMYTAPAPENPPENPVALLDLLSALEPDPTFVWKTDVSAAGLAVRAADSGRVLMVQRDDTGQWEFPGGQLNDGEHPYVGAKREWQEEVGRRLPRGKHVGQARHRDYQLFVHEIPSEASLVDSPGQKGETENIAWWDPEHMKRSQAVRQELHDSRAWDKVQKGSGSLFLISHGKTRYNRPGQPHDIVHGWRDTPLDSTGRGQARKLGKFLQGSGIEQLHASDLKRASETASVISKVVGVPMKASRDFRPWDLGDFAGHSSKDVVPKLKPFMEKDADKPVDGGESFNDFKGRFLPALEKLLTQVQNGKTVGLVTHSRNIELAQGWLGGRGPRKQIDTNAITIDKIDPAVVLEVTPRNGRWRINQIDDQTVRKGQALGATLHLRVNGVSRHSSSHHVYRMVTRDGHYVGRTNPTRRKARKGDVLEITAAHVGMNPEGDFVWANPNVESHYTDSAHSWRELQALAGGTLEKEFADGPAGDPPPNGDSPTGAGSTQMPSAGTLAAMTPAATSEVPVGSGPTITDVHVNRPLRNISTAYMNRKVKVRVHKADPEKQLVYGVVLEPNTLDSQDDFMLPDQVEKAAHSYMKKVARGRAAVSKLQHVKQGFFKNKQSVVPVESYIAPVDFTYDGIEMIKKGTWVMCLHCEDPAIWEAVKSGEYTGLSIGGTGIRRSMHVPPQIVDRGYMEPQQPSDWFTPSGGVAG